MASILLAMLNGLSLLIILTTNSKRYILLSPLLEVKKVRLIDVKQHVHVYIQPVGRGQQKNLYLPKVKHKLFLLQSWEVVGIESNDTNRVCTLKYRQKNITD